MDIEKDPVQLIDSLMENEQKILGNRRELTLIVNKLESENSKRCQNIRRQANIDCDTSLLHLTYQVLRALLNKHQVAWVHNISCSDNSYENPNNLTGTARAVSNWLIEQGFEPFVLSNEDNSGQFSTISYYLAINVSLQTAKDLLARYYASITQ